MKLLVIFILLAIIYCLGSGLFFLNKDREGGRLVKALTWRIALSVGLFCFLILGSYLGWIQPHPL